MDAALGTVAAAVVALTVDSVAGRFFFRDGLLGVVCWHSSGHELEICFDEDLFEIAGCPLH